MAWMKKVAKKAEKKVFGSGGVKGRYGIGKGKGGFKFLQLAKDLEMVKSRLNVEKKFIDTDVRTDFIGQAYGTAEGALAYDITPAISQGVGESQRVGNSLKMTGMSIPLSFTGQAECLSARQIRVSVLKVRSADNGVTALEAFNKVWDVNPLTGFRDYNAPRAYRNSKSDGISVIYSKTTYLPAPTVNVDTSTKDAAIRSMRINLKLNDVLRYTGAVTTPDGFRYIIVIQVNSGNAHPTTAATADIPTVYPLTGITYRLATRFWFVDN